MLYCPLSVNPLIISIGQEYMSLSIFDLDIWPQGHICCFRPCCNLHRIGNQFVEYEHNWSKNERGICVMSYSMNYLISDLNSILLSKAHKQSLYQIWTSSVKRWRGLRVRSRKKILTDFKYIWPWPLNPWSYLYCQTFVDIYTL